MSVIRKLPLLIGIALLGACASQSDDQPLTGTASRSAVVAQGVPGGIIVDQERVEATVIALDPAARTFTLQDSEGNRRTVKAPPEMRNYSQLEVGDKVTATLKVERSIYLREKGETAQEGSSMMLTPPAGSKPGLLVASTQEMIAVIQAIDKAAHTATLRFPDGTTRTFQVRPDVEIKPEYLNRQVVIREDSELAVEVKAAQ